MSTRLDIDFDPSATVFGVLYVCGIDLDCAGPSFSFTHSAI
jgi:hypothetical protein